MTELTDYAKARMIRQALLRATGEANQYGWSDEAIRAQLFHTASKLQAYKVDVTKLSLSEVNELDFGNWDGKLRLVPLWLFPYLAEGQRLTSINGEEKTVNLSYRDRNSPSYIDNDHRFGSVAWGFVPTEVL